MKCALLQSHTAFCRTPKQFKRCGSPNLCRNKHCCCRIGLLFLRLEWGLLLGTQLLLHPAQRVAKSRHIGRAEFRNNGIRFPKGYTFSGACAYCSLKKKCYSRVDPPDFILVFDTHRSLVRVRIFDNRRRHKDDKLACNLYCTTGITRHRFIRFSTRSSTTAGSAKVEVSPKLSCSLAAILRRMRRMIFPERVLGSPGDH